MPYECGVATLLTVMGLAAVLIVRALFRRRAAEDARLNAMADERAGGPFVAVRLEDLP